MQFKRHRTILVNVMPPDVDIQTAEQDFEELISLIRTYGGIVILKVLQKRGRPSAKTFLGTGKAHEVAELVREMHADLVVVNGFLKPNQANHLVDIMDCEIWDRFETIVQIFHKHASTEEAKLQTELCMLKYEFPRLIGKGKYLAQERGYIGGRGAGEKLLEIKRRHMHERITAIEKKLENAKHVQEGQRLRRKRKGFMVAALVGYTNSGKSTLLRALTKKDNILVENKLFSTLDTRIGQLFLGNGAIPSNSILVADTIGFIRELPPLLFNSFLTTLQEVKDADILLHVIDSTDQQCEEKIKIVEDILEQLGCGNKKKIYVFNKTDLLSGEQQYKNQNGIPTVFISAEKKLHLDDLRAAIARHLAKLPTHLPVGV